MKSLRTAVLGGGSWGTALAKLLAEHGHPVRLWCRSDALALAINQTGENKHYLPGFKLPSSVSATHDLEQALQGAQLVLLVIPSHGLRDLLPSLSNALPQGAYLVSASKGIENGTLMLVSEMLEESLPVPQHRFITVLSGPSFAREVASGAPTAVTLAGRSRDVAFEVQEALNTDRFRVYTSDDIVGVQLGGSLKNVIAIAAGISEGLGFGHSARAALITRGLAEMARLATRLGAHPLTLSGLSGMGDLVLTCTGELSRNRRVGLELGKGNSLTDILSQMNMVAEGVRTAKSAYELSQRTGVDMPIVCEVYHVLYEGKSAREAVVTLTTRAPRPERD